MQKDTEKPPVQTELTATPATFPTETPQQALIPQPEQSKTAALSIKAEKPTSVRSFLNSETFKKQLALVCTKTLTPERMMRVALTAVLKTPKIADCEMQSVAKCCYDSAALGLEPDGRLAYLIPYKKTIKVDGKFKQILECTLQIGFQGLVELCIRSGKVISIYASPVCENDRFYFKNGEATHEIDFKSPRGKPYAYVATARLLNNVTQSEVMTIEEIESIRDKSQGYQAAKQFNSDSVWESFFGEMAKKTVIKRLCKMLPKSSEISQAIELDNQYNPLSLGQFSTKASTGPVFDLPPAALEEGPSNDEETEGNQ
jgi:recombination protein RecT